MPRTEADLMESILKNIDLTVEDLVKLMIKVGYGKDDLMEVVSTECPKEFKKEATKQFYDTWTQEGADSVDISDFEPSHDESRD